MFAQKERKKQNMFELGVCRLTECLSRVTVAFVLLSEDSERQLVHKKANPDARLSWSKQLLKHY